MKRILCMLLCAALCASFSCAVGEAADAADLTVITVNGEAISYGEMKERLRLELFLGALKCAGCGYALDIVDPLVIADQADKLIFATEDRIVVRQLARERGVALEEADLEAARARAEEDWERYRGIVLSENGMAFLPAGDYTSADDPQETADRYLASFGLTREALFERACVDALDEKQKADWTIGMEGDEDDLLNAYVDWQLSFFDAAVIEEDTERLAALQETLWVD